MIRAVANDRVLYVLRHAKSDWTTAALSDFDRPLASRGERAVDLLAAHLRERRIAPELVLSSPARRARQTAEGVLPESPVTFDDDLYGATYFELMARLRQIDRAVASVLLVGHNPGLHDLVEILSGADIGKYPTGGLATLAVRAAWPDLDAGAATLEGLVRPRDLE
jgi:phosphohistidine phosphatase